MRSLDIVVCIKPVPDPKQWNKLVLDPGTMLLRRSGIPAVINPLDRNAITQAVLCKTEHGGTISVVCMAPPESADQLVEALAMGCDRAFLLTDKAFAGADTLATARCLAAAIRKIGRFDLIFCGAYSLDGSTSQVGPQVAEFLGLPDLSHAAEIRITDTVARARCRKEDAPTVCEAELPVLITVAQEACRAKLPNLIGLRHAAETPIVTWTSKDLDLAPEEVGLQGSPTQMLNVFTPPVGRKGEILQGTPDQLASQLVQRLRGEKILR